MNFRSSALRFLLRRHRPRHGIQELLQIVSPEQPVAIGWISMHRNLAVGSPGRLVAESASIVYLPGGGESWRKQ